MLNTNDINEFEQAVLSVTLVLKNKLMKLPDEIKSSCKEVRLKVNRPVMLYCGNEYLYLKNDSGVSDIARDVFICSKEIINDTYTRMCGYSVHTHHADIIKGFITLDGGHRVGVVGTAVVDAKGNILSVRDVSSINIRISREVSGCAEKIMNHTKNSSFLIVGPPSSGKTTILRDAVKLLSDSGKKVSLIDERNEISCTQNGINYKNVGINTDVYCSYPKEIAINIALRTMSPDYIAVDEVCEDKEISSIILGSNCGVRFIVTVHAACYSEILNRRQIVALISSGAFDKLILLDKNPESRFFSVIDVGDIKDEINRSGNCMDRHCLCGV